MRIVNASFFNKPIALIAAFLISAISMAATAQGDETLKPTFQIQDDHLTLSHGDQALSISLASPRFIFSDGIDVAPVAPLSIKGDLAAGERLIISYAPIPLGESGTLKVALYLEWDAKDHAFRKWATYQPEGDFETITIRDIELETIDTAEFHVDFLGQEIQSYPAFLDGFFVGIEYPVATTHMNGDQLILAHRPGRIMKPGEQRLTRKAVYGLTPVGHERAGFKNYIQAHRPQPNGLHYNYNSWWTSSVPFSVDEILGLVADFHENLYKSNGIGFDSFTIDMGWSKKDGVWEIDENKFPEGFTPLAQAMKAMDSDLGLWISPTNFYSPGSFDNEWAKDNGFETFVIKWGENEVRLCSLAGEKYATAFRERLVDMVSRFGIRQVKLDGYYLQSTEAGPDYEAGRYSTEAMAEGGLAAFEALRKTMPDIWLEATCFGFNPSPWWLFYCNSVIGTYGDDAPRGRVPSPVYRESYTTARDYYNLQGAARLPIPINGQEILGIIHQSNEPFLNDAVVTLLRGHAFISLYINPKFMNGRRWRMLGDLLKWGRANEKTLAYTVALLPAAWQAEGAVPEFTPDAEMPREPYGYAHFKDGQSLILLRNPWIAPQSYRLTLDESIGFPAGKSYLKIVSLYPGVRLYGDGVQSGDTIDIPLAPYETVVLSLTTTLAAEDIPTAKEIINNRIKAESVKQSVACVKFKNGNENYGPDWTRLITDESSVYRVRIDGKIKIDTPNASLLILAEGNNKDPDLIASRLLIDGRKTETTTQFSTAGWSATMIPQEEFWTFVEVPIASGEHDISLEFFALTTSKSLRAWVWGYDDDTEKVALADYPNRLPAPERLSLDAVALSDAIALRGPLPIEKGEVPIERIEGVFLDSITPVSASQGWGDLQRNRSVWEKPIIIAGRKFRRGLGTHSPAQITYDLTPGQYRRFQAWVGADNATGPSVTFEVWLDGAKAWESGVMTQGDEARRIDLDVDGVKTLQLRVGDGGNGNAADHADWADAMLLH